MASIAYNTFKLVAFEATFNLETAAGVKMLLLDAIVTVPDNPDHDFVNDIVADEFADTNYTGGFGGAGRKALATRAATANLTDNRAEFDFDNIVWTSLGGTETARFAIIVREVTTDADSNLVTAHDIADTVTNATDFTLTVGTTGAIHNT